MSLEVKSSPPKCGMLFLLVGTGTIFLFFGSKVHQFFKCFSDGCRF